MRTKVAGVPWMYAMFCGSNIQCSKVMPWLLVKATRPPLLVHQPSNFPVNELPVTTGLALQVESTSPASPPKLASSVRFLAANSTLLTWQLLMVVG